MCCVVVLYENVSRDGGTYWYHIPELLMVVPSFHRRKIRSTRRIRILFNAFPVLFESTHVRRSYILYMSDDKGGMGYDKGRYGL